MKRHLIATLLAAFAAFFTSTAFAANEKIMKTEEGGYLVLTSEPCATGAKDYPWKAYALHVGDKEIEGCWQDIGEAVNVIFPDGPHVYNFSKKLFSAKDK